MSHKMSEKRMDEKVREKRKYWGRESTREERVGEVEKKIEEFGVLDLSRSWKVWGVGTAQGCGLVGYGRKREVVGISGGLARRDGRGS